MAFLESGVTFIAARGFQTPGFELMNSTQSSVELQQI